ncbi:hypothetical protein R6Q59_012702 [Mikania micrantha]
MEMMAIMMMEMVVIVMMFSVADGKDGEVRRQFPMMAGVVNGVMVAFRWWWGFCRRETTLWPAVCLKQRNMDWKSQVSDKKRAVLVSLGQRISFFPMGVMRVTPYVAIMVTPPWLPELGLRPKRVDVLRVVVVGWWRWRKVVVVNAVAAAIVELREDFGLSLWRWGVI